MVDALASGASGRKAMEVRLLFRPCNLAKKIGEAGVNNFPFSQRFCARQFFSERKR